MFEILLCLLIFWINSCVDLDLIVRIKYKKSKRSNLIKISATFLHDPKFPIFHPLKQFSLPLKTVTIYIESQPWTWQPSPPKHQHLTSPSTPTSFIQKVHGWNPVCSFFLHPYGSRKKQEAFFCNRWTRISPSDIGFWSGGERV